MMTITRVPPLWSMFALTCLAWVSQTQHAAAQRPTDFTPLQIVTTPVAGGVYQMESPISGNTAVFAGPDGIVLVDSQYAPMHDKLVSAVRKLSNEPIRFLINTHNHRDHVEGNLLFAKEGVTIVAHENVRKILSTGPAGNPASDAEIRLDALRQAAAVTMVTFTDTLSLHLNGEDISLIHVEPAHSDADILVYFRRAKVMHVGDLIVTNKYPSVPILDGWFQAVDRILKLASPDTKFIVGHGPAATMRDVQDCQRMVATVRDRIMDGIRSGRTLDQIIASKPATEFGSKYTQAIPSADTFVKEIYQQLAKGK